VCADDSSSSDDIPVAALDATVPGDEPEPLKDRKGGIPSACILRRSFVCPLLCPLLGDGDVRNVERESVVAVDVRDIWR
jgi:hypothetical protein